MRRAFAVVLLLAAALYGGLATFIRTPSFQTEVSDRVRPLVQEHLNMTVDWSYVELRPLQLAVTLHDFRAFSGKTTEGTPFLASPRVSARVSWLALLDRHVEIDPIIVERPVARFGNDGENWINFLDVDAIDELTSAESDGLPSAWRLTVGRVKLIDADVDFFLTSIDLRAHLVEFSAEGRFDRLSDEDIIPIRVTGGRGLYRMFGRDFQLADLQADMAVEIIDGPWVDIVFDEAMLRGAYPNATLYASGRIVDVTERHLFKLRGWGETELNFLNEIFFDEPALTGAAAFDVFYDGDFEDFTVKGDVTSDQLLVGSTDVENVAATASVTLQGLSIDKLSANVFGGFASGSGKLGFDDLAWSGDIEGDGLDWEMMRRAVSTLPGASGAVDVKFVGSGAIADGMPVRGHGSVRSPSLAFDLPDDKRIGFTSLELDSPIHWDGDRLFFEGLRLVDSRQELRLTGTVSPQEGAMLLDYSLRSGDLSPVELLTGFPLEGWGTAEGTLRGTLDEPYFESNFTVRDVGLPWFRADEVKGRLEVSNDILYLTELAAKLGGGEAWLPAGVISDLSGEPFIDLQVDAYDVPVELALAPLLQDLPIEGRFTGVFILSSAVTSPTGYAEGEVTDAKLWGEPLETVDGKLQLDAGGLSFSNVRAWRESTELTGTGRLSPEGEFRLRLRGKNVLLEETAFLDGLPLSGRASALLKIETDGDGISSLNLDADVSDAHVYGVSAGEVTARLAGDSEALSFEARSLSGTLFAQTMLNDRYDSSVTGTFRRIDLTPLLQDRLAGDVNLNSTGNFEYTGPLLDFEDGAGTLQIDNVLLSQGRTKLSNDGRAYVDLKNGNVILRRVALVGEKASGTLSGSIGLDGNLDIESKGALELQMFTLFVEQLKSATGELLIDGVVKGTLDAPVITTRLRVKDGKVQLRDVNLLFEDITASGVLADGRIVLDSFRSKVGSGSVGGGGVIGMDGFIPSTVSLYATLTEVESRIPAWLLVRVSGKVEMTGPIDDVLLSGNLEIIRALYNERLDWESMILRVRQNTGTRRLESEKGLHLDLGLHSAGSILVRNNLADLRLRGDLRLFGYPPDIGMTGNLQVVDGQIVFRENVFQIQNAQVNFVNEDELRPFIDLRAKTRVEELTSSAARRFSDIFLDASGPPDDLQIELESSPPMSREDILSLLYIKRRTTEETVGGSGTATAEAVSLAFKLNDDLAGFQSEVQEYFGFENLVLEPAFADTSRSGTMKLRAEKMISPNLKASLSTSLSSTDLDFWLGYGLTDNVLFDLGWNSIGEEELQTRQSNFGNFKVRPRLHFEF